MPTNARFINSGGGRGEIWLYDPIGNDGWGSGIGAKDFAASLRELGAVTAIDLRINSPGGSVFDGVAIYNQLMRHGAHIAVHVDGLAASIASVIAMAGDEINIAENAMMMIHDPAGGCMGCADDMRKTADLLDSVKNIIVDTYDKRTKAGADKLAAWMADETWFNAADAVSLGFADSITAAQTVSASYDGFNLSQYRNVPAPVLNRANGFAARDIAAVRLGKIRVL